MIQIIFKTLQARDMINSQQRVEFDKLMTNICGIGIWSKQDGLFNEYQDLDYILFNGDRYILFDSIRDHIDDQGSWTRDSFLEMDQNTKNDIIKVIDHFVLSFVTQASMIQSEHDSNKNVRELETPSIMPSYIVKLPTQKFISEVLDRFWTHVEKRWSPEDIDQFEEEHKELLNALKNDSTVKMAL